MTPTIAPTTAHAPAHPPSPPPVRRRRRRRPRSNGNKPTTPPGQTKTPASREPAGRTARQAGPAADALGRSDDAARLPVQHAAAERLHPPHVRRGARRRGRSRRPGGAVPRSIVKGGPVIDAGPGQPRSGTAGPHHRAHLRRRPGSASGHRRSSTCCSATTSTRPSSSSAPRSPRTRSWPGGSSLRATRSACTPSPTPNLGDASPAGGGPSSCGRASSILAGATGVTTTLLRPPYSSEPSALTDRDWDAIEHDPARPAT